MDDQSKDSIRDGWKQAGLWCLLGAFLYALALPCLQTYGWLRFGRWAEAPGNYLIRRPEVLETRSAREQSAWDRVRLTASDKKPLDIEAAKDVVRAEQNVVRFVPSLQLDPGEESHDWVGVRKIAHALGEIHLSVWLLAFCWFGVWALTYESPEHEKARRDREQKAAHARLQEQYLAQEAWEQKKAEMAAAEANTDHGAGLP